MTSQENKKVDAKFIIGLPQRYDFGLTREIWIQYAGEYKGLSDLSWILYPLGRENSQHCFQFQGKGCRGQFEKNKLHTLHSVVHMKKKSLLNLRESLSEDCSKRRLHCLRGQRGRRAIESFTHYLPNSFHECLLSSESDTGDQPAASIIKEQTLTARKYLTRNTRSPYPEDILF